MAGSWNALNVEQLTISRHSVQIEEARTGHTRPNRPLAPRHLEGLLSRRLEAVCLSAPMSLPCLRMVLLKWRASPLHHLNTHLSSLKEPPAAGTATFVVLNLTTAAIEETAKPKPSEPMRGRLVERTTASENKLPVVASPVQSVDTSNSNWQTTQAAREAQQQVLVVTQTQQGILAPTGPYGQLQLHEPRSMVDPVGVNAAVR